MKVQPIAGLVIAIFAIAGCSKESSDAPVAVATETTCVPQAVADVPVVEIAPGLTGRTLTTGCGDVAAALGHIAVVHYTGWLFDSDAENNRGQKFDSSRDRGEHFKFPLGGRVIKGWNLGVAGMHVGEVRELTIAPELAYGDRDLPQIPAGSTLVFEVELADLEGSAVDALPPQN